MDSQRAKRRRSDDSVDTVELEAELSRSGEALWALEAQRHAHEGRVAEAEGHSARLLAEMAGLRTRMERNAAAAASSRASAQSLRHKEELQRQKGDSLVRRLANRKRDKWDARFSEHLRQVFDDPCLTPADLVRASTVCAAWWAAAEETLTRRADLLTRMDPWVGPWARSRGLTPASLFRAWGGVEARWARHSPTARRALGGPGAGVGAGAGIGVVAPSLACPSSSAALVGLARLIRKPCVSLQGSALLSYTSTPLGSQFKLWALGIDERGRRPVAEKGKSLVNVTTPPGAGNQPPVASLLKSIPCEESPVTCCVLLPPSFPCASAGATAGTSGSPPHARPTSKGWGRGAAFGHDCVRSGDGGGHRPCCHKASKRARVAARESEGGDTNYGGSAGASRSLSSSGRDSSDASGGAGADTSTGTGRDADAAPIRGDRGCQQGAGSGLMGWGMRSSLASPALSPDPAVSSGGDVGAPSPWMEARAPAQEVDAGNSECGDGSRGSRPSQGGSSQGNGYGDLRGGGVEVGEECLDGGAGGVFGGRGGMCADASDDLSGCWHNWAGLVCTCGGGGGDMLGGCLPKGAANDPMGGFLTGHLDGCVRLWDISSGTVVRVYSPSSHGGSTAVMGATGSRQWGGAVRGRASVDANGCVNKRARDEDVGTACAASAPMGGINPAAVATAAVNVNGTRNAGRGGGSIDVEPIHAVAIGPCGALILVYAATPSGVLVWDLWGGTLLFRLTHPSMCAAREGGHSEQVAIDGVLGPGMGKGLGGMIGRCVVADAAAEDVGLVGASAGLGGEAREGLQRGGFGGGLAGSGGRGKGREWVIFRRKGAAGAVGATSGALAARPRTSGVVKNMPHAGGGGGGGAAISLAVDNGRVAYANWDRSASIMFTDLKAGRVRPLLQLVTLPAVADASCNAGGVVDTVSERGRGTVGGQGDAGGDGKGDGKGHSKGGDAGRAPAGGSAPDRGTAEAHAASTALGLEMGALPARDILVDTSVLVTSIQTTSRPLTAAVAVPDVLAAASPPGQGLPGSPPQRHLSFHDVRAVETHASRGSSGGSGACGCRPSPRGGAATLDLLGLAPSRALPACAHVSVPNRHDAVGAPWEGEEGGQLLGAMPARGVATDEHEGRLAGADGRVMQRASALPTAMHVPGMGCAPAGHDDRCGGAGGGLGTCGIAVPRNALAALDHGHGNLGVGGNDGGAGSLVGGGLWSDGRKAAAASSKQPRVRLDAGCLGFFGGDLAAVTSTCHHPARPLVELHLHMWPVTYTAPGEDDNAGCRKGVTSTPPVTTGGAHTAKDDVAGQTGGVVDGVSCKRRAGHGDLGLMGEGVMMDGWGGAGEGRMQGGQGRGGGGVSDLSRPYTPLARHAPLARQTGEDEVGRGPGRGDLAAGGHEGACVRRGAVGTEHTSGVGRGDTLQREGEHDVEIDSRAARARPHRDSVNQRWLLGLTGGHVGADALSRLDTGGTTGDRCRTVRLGMANCPHVNAPVLVAFSSHGVLACVAHEPADAPLSLALAAEEAAAGAARMMTSLPAAAGGLSASGSASGSGAGAFVTAVSSEPSRTMSGSRDSVGAAASSGHAHVTTITTGNAPLARATTAAATAMMGPSSGFHGVASMTGLGPLAMSSVLVSGVRASPTTLVAPGSHSGFGSLFRSQRPSLPVYAAGAPRSVAFAAWGQGQASGGAGNAQGAAAMGDADVGVPPSPSQSSSLMLAARGDNSEASSAPRGFLSRGSGGASDSTTISVGELSLSLSLSGGKRSASQRMLPPGVPGVGVDGDGGSSSNSGSTIQVMGVLPDMTTFCVSRGAWSGPGGPPMGGPGPCALAASWRFQCMAWENGHLEVADFGPALGGTKGVTHGAKV